MMHILLWRLGMRYYIHGEATEAGAAALRAVETAGERHPDACTALHLQHPRT